ncbi:MAG: terminase [Treponematales bacterium]
MTLVTLLPHQSEFMQAPFLFLEKRYFFLLAGYGAGKTRALVFSVLYAVKRLQNKRDFAGDYARLIVAGYTLSHLERTFLIYFRQFLVMSRTPFTEDKKHNKILVGTVTILLMPIENPGDIFGEGSWATYVDELDELTEDKALEAVKALSERTRQRMREFREGFLCFASTSQGQKGLYRLYNHFKKNGVGFTLIRARTQDNPFLPKSQIRDMLRTYTPEEREVFMNARFLAIAKGRVLGDFDWERNYLNDMDTGLKSGETVYIGMDFNISYNRASAYVTRDGVIYGIKYYDFPDPRDAPSVFRHDFPEQRILWIPDMTIKDSFPQFARELRRYGIQIIYRKKNPLVEDTVFLVNKLFYTGKLMICRIAKDLAEACALAMRDKDNKIPKGVGPSSPMHVIDGLRYVCSFICARDRAFNDLRRLIIDKRASFRAESENLVQDVGGGCMRIHPNALYRGKKL